jgi:toxin HigB-1
MELAFATRRLRAMCEDAQVAAEVFDEVVVEQLKSRLADLRAVDFIEDLVVGSPAMTGGPAPRVTVELAQGYVMVLVPNHPDPPRSEGGSVDWHRVRRLQLIDIARSEVA